MVNQKITYSFWDNEELEKLKQIYSKHKTERGRPKKSLKSEFEK